ncbi:MAG: putative tRNA-dihydrouridine synthase [Elusimicrobia bacterium]|nr:putative tRNA-dihydrouridine synthase [Elusimicrobiota bacterium]
MFQLKSLTLKSPIIQSPMAGCTDLAYRLVARKRGLEFCFLEMISANGFMHESHRTHELMKTVAEDRPLGIQLMGCDPDIMAKAAQRAEAMGFDLLDMNLGCPVRKVTAAGAGAAMLRDPKNTEQVFKKVMSAIKKIPVTIKMRLGYEDDSGEEAVSIAKIAEGEGLSMITVHGRTRAQGYTGKSNWEAIGKVKRAIKIPVLGNGDVSTAEDAKRLQEVSGCDGVMIGRGGLGNPWIYRQIHEQLFEGKNPEPPTREERIQAVLEHLALEVEHVGEQKAVFHMRRIGSWYIAGVTHASSYRAELIRCQTVPQVREVLLKALSTSKEFRVVPSTLTEGQ